MSMQERNIDWLLLIHTLTGTKPTTQACTLTRNRTSNIPLQDDAQPTEPHQSGPHELSLYVSQNSYISGNLSYQLSNSNTLTVS